MMGKELSGIMIKQIHDEFEKLCNNALRPYDLTMSQLGILKALSEANNEQLSLKDLEQIIHVAQSTIAGLILRLEQKKFVEAFGDQKDKRIKKVRITAEGKLRFIEAEKHILQVEETILKSLTETERMIFLTLLQKIRDSLC